MAETDSQETQTVEQQPLTAEQLAERRRLGEARISPDGERVAFTIAPFGKEGEHGLSTIWLVGFAEGEPRQFTSGLWLDSEPRWSPDGSRLAFLSDRAERGKMSVYVMPTDGGEAIRVFEQQGEMDHLSWSPDGRYLAVGFTEPESEEEKKRKEERDDAVVWDADPKFKRLWVINLETHTASVVSPEARQVWGYCWSPDSARLAINVSRTPRIDDIFNETEVVIVPREGDGSEAKHVFNPSGTAHDLTWSPDGASLAYLGPAGRTVSGDYVYKISIDGGEPLCLTPGYGGTPEGMTRIGDDLLLTAFEGVNATVYRLSWEGELTSLLGAEPWGVITPPATASADGSRLALTWDDPRHATDVWVAELRGVVRPELTRRTHFQPELEEAAIGEVEIVRWQSDPGVEVEGLLYKPHGYEAGKRYPFVVQVHGGPTGQWSNGFIASWHGWAPYLAGRGYAVLPPNPRGSTGRGPDYVNALFGDVGGCEFRDMMSGVDAMIERGVADPERLGVGGWSWGGYMTAWTVSQTDRFKAAVMGAGLPNMISDNSLGDIPSANLSYFETTPYHDPDSYYERSAIRHIRTVTTPTLVLHGAEDRRVAPAEGQEMYIALRTLGVETRFVTYPREPHGIAERKHQLDLLKRILDWYDRHLRSELAESAIEEKAAEARA